MKDRLGGYDVSGSPETPDEQQWGKSIKDAVDSNISRNLRDGCHTHIKEAEDQMRIRTGHSKQTPASVVKEVYDRKLSMGGTLGQIRGLPETAEVKYLKQARRGRGW